MELTKKEFNHFRSVKNDMCSICSTMRTKLVADAFPAVSQSPTMQIECEHCIVTHLENDVEQAFYGYEED